MRQLDRTAYACRITATILRNAKGNDNEVR